MLTCSGELLLQFVRLLGQFELSDQSCVEPSQVFNAVFDKPNALRLCSILQADQKRDRGVLDRCALRPGDALHSIDTGNLENCFGNFVQDEEIRRISQVVV